MRIRNARSDDHAAFLSLFAELRIDDPPQDAQRFSNELVPTTLIAERDGVAVGYVFYRPLDKLVHLAHLAVASTARRSGAGRALVREVARRAKEHGCTRMFLNVKPDNAAAIALYESEGLARGATSHAMKIPWNLVDALPSSAVPFASDARPIDPADEARIEAALGLAGGMLAERRRSAKRVLLAIERARAGEGLALAVFEPAFPGAHPFRAPTPAHALSLLRALRPFALPEHDHVNFLLEDDAALANALRGSGAILRFEILQMNGPIRT
jgi:GNAT superfamily N-acetyltransferase